MYSGYETKYGHEAFIDELHTNEGMDKFASGGTNLIRTKLYERSVADKILAPVQVDEHRLIPGIPGITPEQGDSFYTWADLELEAEAMSLNYRGLPDARYIHGSRFYIALGQWASERLQKSEEELKATGYNLVKSLDTICARQIDKERDRLFMRLANQAVTATSQHFTASGNLTKVMLSNLAEPIISNQLNAHVYLMSQNAFQQLSLWGSTDLDIGAEKVTTEGYIYSKVLGRLFIRSIKSDLFDTYHAGRQLNTTNIYCFTTPDALGCNLLWGVPRIFSQWEGNLFTWWSWLNGGMAFGNNKGVSRLTLTTSATQ